MELEKLGMYNWTDDIPTGTKQNFINILKFSKAKNILEIGSYTGTSLIGMMDILGPETVATAVDIWDTSSPELENQNFTKIEEAFDNNIKKAGKTVRKIKGDSQKVMRDILSPEKFDFIYIDGNHTCFNVMVDLVLAWEILKPGGVMAIDDYTWNKDDFYNSPFRAVNHFLKTYKDEYILLGKGYRVFVHKKNTSLPSIHE